MYRHNCCISLVVQYGFISISQGQGIEPGLALSLRSPGDVLATQLAKQLPIREDRDTSPIAIDDLQRTSMTSKKGHVSVGTQSWIHFCTV